MQLWKWKERYWMIYAQDYASFQKMVCLLMLCVSVVGLVYCSMRLLQRSDKTAIFNKRTTIIAEICLCLLSGEVVLGFGKLCAWTDSTQTDTAMGMLQGSIVEIVLLSVFVGCLLTACIMDIESQMVYNYVWWTACLAAGLLLCWKGINIGLELILFILLQEVAFARLYGRADCHAFAACAMIERALGMAMKEYLVHMLLAYVLLAVVQGFKRNIGKNGNLKTPIPFIPYIAVSLFVLIYWEKSAILIRV